MQSEKSSRAFIRTQGDIAIATHFRDPSISGRCLSESSNVHQRDSVHYDNHYPMGDRKTRFEDICSDRRTGESGVAAGYIRALIYDRE
jgi:hypothetical protein